MKYDRSGFSEELQIGDQVLVRNLSERGGTGKLRPFYEEEVHVIVEKLTDLPAFKVKQMQGDKIRTLHQNHLKKCQLSHNPTPLPSKTSTQKSNEMIPEESTHQTSEEEEELQENLGILTKIWKGRRTRNLISKQATSKQPTILNGTKDDKPKGTHTTASQLESGANQQDLMTFSSDDEEEDHLMAEQTNERTSQDLVNSGDAVYTDDSGDVNQIDGPDESGDVTHADEMASQTRCSPSDDSDSPASYSDDSDTGTVHSVDDSRVQVTNAVHSEDSEGLVSHGLNYSAGVVHTPHEPDEPTMGDGEIDIVELNDPVSVVSTHSELDEPTAGDRELNLNEFDDSDGAVYADDSGDVNQIDGPAESRDVTHANEMASQTCCSPSDDSDGPASYSDDSDTGTVHSVNDSRVQVTNAVHSEDSEGLASHGHTYSGGAGYTPLGTESNEEDERVTTTIDGDDKDERDGTDADDEAEGARQNDSNSFSFDNYAGTLLLTRQPRKRFPKKIFTYNERGVPSYEPVPTNKQ